MDDIARVTQKNLKVAGGYGHYHDALVHIRFNFSIILRKEKQGKKDRLNDTYENKNGKEVDFVIHFVGAESAK
jgi:hypothetical protein